MIAPWLPAGTRVADALVGDADRLGDAQRAEAAGIEHAGLAACDGLGNRLANYRRAPPKSEKAKRWDRISGGATTSRSEGQCTASSAAFDREVPYRTRVPHPAA